MKKIGLDVRNEEEVIDNPAPSSVHIPLGRLPDEVESEISDKTSNILVFCEKGGRAERAKEYLESLGYSSVENFGTWREWNESLKK
jgi:rhodanese-related sulfurtransferase